MTNKLIYLASPYSDDDPALEAYRFEVACHAVAEMTLAGHMVLSPIVHSHPIFVRRPDLGSGYEHWEELDERLILAADEVWVLGLYGWSVSVGVCAEIEFAKGNGKPVQLVTRAGEIVKQL